MTDQEYERWYRTHGAAHYGMAVAQVAVIREQEDIDAYARGEGYLKARGFSFANINPATGTHFFLKHYPLAS